MSTRTALDEWRRGWPVVAGAAVGIGVSPGLFQNLSSLFVPGMIADFGWTRGQIATAAGVGLAGALTAPWVGRLSDRIGVRPIILAGTLLLVLAYLFGAAMTGHLWQYQLLILLLALALPGTSTMTFGKLIAQRFEHHRGVALAFAVSGVSVTTVTLAPILGWTIERFGWRAGLVALAALTGVVALPLILLAIRGIATGPTRPKPDAPHAAEPVAGITAREARRQPRFWLLATCAALINAATAGLVTQLAVFGTDRGLTPETAALLLTGYGAGQVAGRFGIGLLIDRLPPQRVAAAFAGASAIGFLLLQLPQPGFALLILAVFAASLINGAEHDLLPYLGVRLFGLRAYGEIYGIVLAVALLGTAIGIVGYGRLHDATGSYALPLAFAAIALSITAAFFLRLRDVPLPEAQARAH